ncbi:uncharacterized protein L201_006738 [Kwoniella dendrophila CBS 6074]|uniref:Ubiquitin-like domain-containing protein n=1 Tax=Kwoniella dendrophila CBS 6074 TaxID=1295534 RepID=A0AAX4K2I4_9TREE
MPPKSSNLHHVTFHFNKSAILLSLPSNTTINSIKTQLLPALEPLSSTLSEPKTTKSSDIQLWEYKSPVEGQEQNANGEKEIHNLESQSGISGKTISQLGWSRWKTLFISFKASDGTFPQPTYTIPDVEDEEPDGSEA